VQANTNISQAIKDCAVELGFSACAIVPADFLSEEKEHLHSWLGKNMHGEMEYMARNIEKRLDPRLLQNDAQTIVIVLQNYFPSKHQADQEAPVLSKYAYGKDYHFVIKRKLNKLLEFIQEKAGPCSARSFTDSAPVLERAWARRAGLGWIGKNSNLISIHHGSFFFIGELILDIRLPYDTPKAVSDHCGSCTRCIDACPTKAIVANRVVDATKCISYQTIENKGDIDNSLAGKFENRVFGCDICQDVCPWNLKSEPHQEPLFEPHPKLASLTRHEWHHMERTLFNELFRNSAVKRAGYGGLKRNLRFIEKQDKS
jgi:epoxyqueuosine reductase